MTALAFIDLLATKDSALVGEDEFEEAMEKFHDTLINCRGILKSGFKFRHFADCCYIEAESTTELLEFIQNVRFYLFTGRKFFKCAVSLGSLEEVNIREKYGSEISGDDIIGSSFTGEVATVYLNVEKFKGVGVYLDEMLVRSLSDAERQKFCAEGAFFPSDEKIDLQKYYDLKLSPYEIKTSDGENEHRQGLSSPSRELLVWWV